MAGTDTWIAAGVVIAGLGLAGAFLLWLRHPATALFAVLGHDKRLAALEREAVTRTQFEQMAHDFNVHERADALAFNKIDAEFANMREHMARREDLAKLEDNLTEILMDGFKKNAARP